jgi:transcriptional regulator with XRE-family HTH domain
MTMKQWEKKVLQRPGAPERVAEIEDELRLATGLIALREKAGLSQRELAKRIGISQPRVAAIEQSRNVTIDVLNQYVNALGGKLEVAVVKGHHKTPLLGVKASVKAASKRSPQIPAAAKRGTAAR